MSRKEIAFFQLSIIFHIHYHLDTCQLNKNNKHCYLYFMVRKQSSEIQTALPKITRLLMMEPCIPPRIDPQPSSLSRYSSGHGRRKAVASPKVAIGIFLGKDNSAGRNELCL